MKPLLRRKRERGKAGFIPRRLSDPELYMGETKLLQTDSVSLLFSTYSMYFVHFNFDNFNRNSFSDNELIDQKSRGILNLSDLFNIVHLYLYDRKNKI